MIFDRSALLELFSDYLQYRIDDIHIDFYCDNDKMFLNSGTLYMHPETYHNFVNNQLTPFMKKKNIS